MTQQIRPASLAHLSARDRERLTVWKMIYVLQADGFTREQARRLVFCRILYQRGRLVA